LQDWCNCINDIPSSQEKAVENNTNEITIEEGTDVLCRLRCLFDQSDYYQQILLMQAAPLEWGWKKMQNFFRCTSHQARHAIIQRTNSGNLAKLVDNRGNKSLDCSVAEAVEDFYLDDEVSRQSSNTKDSRKSKNHGTVVIRYMIMSIGETFELFKLQIA